MTTDERFWDKVRKTDSCWEWMAGRFASGYGCFSLKGKATLAHHYLKGHPGPGLEADHLCRNRVCVNPDHLEFVTSAENSRRSPIIGRTATKPKGFAYNRELAVTAGRKGGLTSRRCKVAV